MHHLCSQIQQVSIANVYIENHDADTWYIGLSPEHMFPAAVNDLKATYDWMINTMHVPVSKLFIGK